MWVCPLLYSNPPSIQRVYVEGVTWLIARTAIVKVTGAFQKSTEIMKTTNQLVKLPQLSATMREMSMEMMKVPLPSLIRASVDFG